MPHLELQKRVYPCLTSLCINPGALAKLGNLVSALFPHQDVIIRILAGVAGRPVVAYQSASIE